MHVYLCALVPGVDPVGAFLPEFDEALVFDDAGRHTLRDAARLLQYPPEAASLATRLRPQFPLARPAVPLSKPSVYIVCTRDRVIQPDWQQRAAREGLANEPIENRRGRSPMLTHARGARRTCSSGSSRHGRAQHVRTISRWSSPVRRVLGGVNALELLAVGDGGLQLEPRPVALHLHGARPLHRDLRHRRGDRVGAVRDVVAEAIGVTRERAPRTSSRRCRGARRHSTPRGRGRRPPASSILSILRRGEPAGRRVTTRRRVTALAEAAHTASRTQSVPALSDGVSTRPAAELHVVRADRDRASCAAVARSARRRPQRAVVAARDEARPARNVTCWGARHRPSSTAAVRGDPPLFARRSPRRGRSARSRRRAPRTAA